MLNQKNKDLEQAVSIRKNILSLFKAGLKSTIRTLSFMIHKMKVSKQQLLVQKL